MLSTNSGDVLAGQPISPEALFASASDNNWIDYTDYAQDRSLALQASVCYNEYVDQAMNASASEAYHTWASDLSAQTGSQVENYYTWADSVNAQRQSGNQMKAFYGSYEEDASSCTLPEPLPAQIYEVGLPPGLFVRPR